MEILKNDQFELVNAIDNNDLFTILDFPSSIQHEVPSDKYEQKLCTLQQILFNDNDIPLTKEAVLDKAITVLSASRNQHPAPISNSLFDAYHAQELECAFQYIARKQISFGLEFSAYRTIENFKEALSTLKSIAHELDVEYKLKVTVFEVASMSLFQFNVKTSTPLLDNAVTLYSEAKAARKDTASIIGGHDSLVRIYFDKAFLAFLKGDFKSAVSFWKGARNIGANSFSTPLFIVPFCIFKTLLDSLLTKAEVAALADFSSDISLAPFRFFISACIGMSIAKDGYINDGISMLREAIKAGTERFGSIIEQVLACGVLRVYVDGKMYREAVNYADTVVYKSNLLKLQDVGMDSNINGTNKEGLFEVYRYKAIALFRMLTESESSLDNVQVYIRVGEILKVLQGALQQLAGRECWLLELKLTIVLAEVLQKYGNRAQKVEVLEKLNSYLEKIVYEDSLCSGSEELKKAHRILEELSSLVLL